MSSMLFFTIFFVLLGIYTIIGIWASHGMHTIKDYFLAGKDLTLWPLVFTLLATQVGGGMLLGTAQEAYTVGFYGFTYTLGMAIGFILLGAGFASRMQSLNVATTAELFETKYNSLLLKKIASLLSIATMSGILIAQVIGSKKLLLSLGFFNEPMFIAFWFFTIWYTMAGGLRAVVLTDCVQILFIIAMFMGLAGYITWAFPSTLSDIWSAQDLFSSANIDVHTLIATLLMPILFSLIEQDLAQRFFAAKTPAIARMSAFLSALGLLLFSAIPIFFGMHARILGIAVPENTSPLMPYITLFASDLVAVLAACAIIAAITSTADSLLCAIASNLGQDFDVTFLSTNPIKRSRYLTLIIGLGALGLSYCVSASVIGILIASYELSVSCLLIPLLFAYFKKKVHTQAAYFSIIAGLFGFICFRYVATPIPKEIMTLSLSLFGYMLGHMIDTE